MGFMNVLLLFIICYCIMAREDPEAIFQRLFMVVNEKPSGLKGGDYYTEQNSNCIF